MPPTMEVESAKARTPVITNWENVSEGRPGGPAWGPAGLAELSQDFTANDRTQGCRAVIPEASPVFMEVMGTMKSEHAQSSSKKGNTVSDKDVASSQAGISTSPSFLSKLKSAFKTTSAISPHLVPNQSEGVPSVSSTSNKKGNPRRPASFGGADLVKPVAGRRASHYEKRVKWADEPGSNHPLFSVKLIKPRVSAEAKPSHLSTPGHSILRNTGIH